MNFTNLHLLEVSSVRAMQECSPVKSFDVCRTYLGNRILWNKIIMFKRQNTLNRVLYKFDQIV